MGKLRRLLARLTLLIHRIRSAEKLASQNAAPPPDASPLAKELSYRPDTTASARWRNRNGPPVVRSTSQVSRGNSLLASEKRKRVKRVHVREEDELEEVEAIELDELNVEYWFGRGVMEGEAGRAAIYHSKDLVNWEVFGGGPLQVSLYLILG